MPLFSREEYKGTFVLFEPITEGLPGTYESTGHRFLPQDR